MVSVEHQKLQEILSRHGLEHFGWTPLTRPLSIDLYKNWVAEGQHLDMAYLKEHLPIKENPRAHHQAHSAIVLSVPYWPHPWPHNQSFKNNVALYARGKDYHHEIQRQLTPLLDELKGIFPEHSFELFTDSAPILERDLAYRAGLGWIGKNTCLIDRRHGSMFFIAEVYTTLKLETSSPWSPDFCGRCNRCVEACPTGALTSDRRLLPSKCIAYWTIESKSVPPETLCPAFGDWLFGCDICQTVCPWNQKHLLQTLKATGAPPPEDANTPLQKTSSREERVKELEWILTSSRKALARALHETPLSRVAGWKLQRNAIIVATNNNYRELLPAIVALEEDPKLQSLARWSIEHLEQNQ